MKCPKCGYTSFDYLMECKKCGEILEDCRRALNLRMNEPTIFTNLEVENEPTYINDDDLRIAESLDDSDIAQESLALGGFQPPLDAGVSGAQETEPPAAGLENDVQFDDFDLELDTLTPLSPEADRKTDNITFDGFAEAHSGSEKIELEAVPEEKDSFSAGSLLEGNAMPSESGSTENSGEFNLDMELPFDFSETGPAKPETEERTGVVELNLDDDEDLDKILADLGADDKNK